MAQEKTLFAQKSVRIGLAVLLWAVVLWLVYPLLAFDARSLIGVRPYFYRAIMGIMLMIIAFGKTVVDLFFPVDLSNKRAITYSILLTIYSLLLVGGIIFMIARVILVYINTSVSSDTGFSY